MQDKNKATEKQDTERNLRWLNLNRETVLADLLKNNPKLTREEALEYLKAEGL